MEQQKPACFGHYFEQRDNVCFGAASIADTCDAICKFRDDCVKLDITLSGQDRFVAERVRESKRAVPKP